MTPLHPGSGGLVWGVLDGCCGAGMAGVLSGRGSASRLLPGARRSIPRTSQQQWTAGPQVPTSQAQPGDLVLFAGSDGTMTAPGHVGIVTGHDTMIDAPFTGQVIRQESYAESTDLVGFTRP